MKGQASFEYLLVVAIVFITAVPATYFLVSYSQDSNEEIAVSQFEDIGHALISQAESVFYAGKGSKSTLTLNFPEGLEAVTIYDQRELAFNISSRLGNEELVFFSRVKLTNGTFTCTTGVPCPIHNLLVAGKKDVVVEALQGEVKIEPK